MKRIAKTFIVALLAILAFSTGHTQGSKPQEPQVGYLLGPVPKDVSAGDTLEPEKGDLLDLAVVSIESPAARALLKSDYIKVRRRRTDYVPEGKLTVLKLEQLNDDICHQRLQQVIQRYSRQDTGDQQIKRMGDILVARVNTSSYWISRGSGAYKFTETRNSMATLAQIDDFREAVQIALDHLGTNQLVEPTDGEEVDILFVSAVRNVLTKVGEAEPREEFTSDYYIGFGRRFRGVPIVGSVIVIRLDGNADVVMVQKLWRTIVHVGPEEAVISNKSIQELVIRDSMFYERYSTEPVSPEDITIIDQRCGYMEAPVNYEQEYLRPGCSVSFGVLKSADESYPEITISIEESDNIQELWGSRYYGQQQEPKN